ncbi:hypothetical protein [Candidatus Uabimicrobium sp. HlEnr_7]|uniref:hypothetical protein n=1 Tax=Candidatus Uabimicrobium helgolandensis TaxID=3095367 RepID=UPI0035566758
MAELISPQRLLRTITDFLHASCNHIFIVLPRLEVNNVLLYYLRKLAIPIVFICCSYSKKSLDTTIAKIENLTIFVTDRIFAQVILTNHSAIYTNVDFEYYLQYDSRGIGFRVDRLQDAIEYNTLRQEIERAIRCGTCLTHNRNITTGLRYCIRCRKEIPSAQVKGLRAYEFKPYSILCNPCFGVWNIYKNYEYGEQCCYVCGKCNNSSVAYPLCRSCFCKHNY